jgi:hypothetical protein
MTTRNQRDRAPSARSVSADPASPAPARVATVERLEDRLCFSVTGLTAAEVNFIGSCTCSGASYKLWVLRRMR